MVIWVTIKLAPCSANAFAFPTVSYQFIKHMLLVYNIPAIMRGHVRYNMAVIKSYLVK